MTKCVEKLNRLTPTIKAQKYYCYYNLGKTIAGPHQRGIGMAAITKSLYLHTNSITKNIWATLKQYYHHILILFKSCLFCHFYRKMII